MSPDSFLKLLEGQQAEFSAPDRPVEVVPLSVGIAAGALFVGALVDRRHDGPGWLVVANDDPQNDTFDVYPARVDDLGNPSDPWGMRVAPRLDAPVVSTLAAEDQQLLRAQTVQSGSGAAAVLTVPYESRQIIPDDSASDGGILRIIGSVDGTAIPTYFGEQPIGRLA